MCGRVKLNVDVGFRYFRMSRRPEIGQSSGVVKSKDFMSLSSYDISLEITMRLLIDLKQISNR